MINQKLLKKFAAVLTLIGSFVLFIFMTNPSDLPVWVLFLPFIWIFLILFFVSRYTASVYYMFVGKQNNRRVKYLAINVSTALTMLLILNSINQLSIRDILIVLVFTVLVSFYFSRLSFGAKDIE